MCMSHQHGHGHVLHFASGLPWPAPTTSTFGRLHQVGCGRIEQYHTSSSCAGGTSISMCFASFNGALACILHFWPVSSNHSSQVRVMIVDYLQATCKLKFWQAAADRLWQGKAASGMDSTLLRHQHRHVLHFAQNGLGLHPQLPLLAGSCSWESF